MTEPEITVRKVGYVVPVSVLGKDEHGRTLVQCPNPGCGDEAYIDEDGRVVCPTVAAMSSYLTAALAQLVDRDNAGEAS